MKINVDAKYVRAVATWTPMIKANDKGSALGNVALWAGDGSLTTMVTDRFRMIYSVVPLPDVADPVGDPLLVPMDLFTRFVAASKGLPDNYPVEIAVGAESVWFNTTSGLSLNNPVVKYSFPKLTEWVASWRVCEDNIAPTVRWEMKRLADLHKFADPAVGVVTAARRDYAWNATAGNPEAYSKAWRFDQGSPDTFAVFVMPMIGGK